MYSRIKYRLKIIITLIPFANGVKRFFLINLAISAIVIMLGFINPLLYKLFIDRVILSGIFSEMPVVIAGYLGIFLLNTLLGYMKNYANYTLVNTTLYRVKSKIWHGFFNLPFPAYENTSVGDMKMRLDDDTGQIQAFAGYQTIDYFLSYISLTGSFVLLIIIDWRLALFSVAAIPVTFLLDNFIAKRESVLNNSNRENDQKMSSWLHASIQGWREVKALNLEHTQEQQYMRFIHKHALFNGKWINYWTARVLVIPKIKDEFFMRFGLYFIGGLLIIGGDLKISDLLVFAMYYGILSDSIKSISCADADLKSNMPFTDRLVEELLRKEAVERKNKINPDNDCTIIVDKVYFNYPNTKKEIVGDLSFIIRKGERVAITGKSGQGKTTVLKLITGMLTPVKGSVLFSGIPLSDIDLPSMHGKIGFVMQENMLFNTTIRENLLYGKNGASDDELTEACKKAYIYNFIMELPDSFNTVIGEKGIKLSGGQRQRIVLARLFLKDVEVFIFDEATSALDQYSENIVHDAIRNISKDKTLIVVAHRESSISLCDRKIEL